MNNKPTTKMMDELNSFLLRQGSKLQYIRNKNIPTIFTLSIIDKFLDSEQCIVNLTSDFENLIRDWFKIRGVDDIGFSNTVKTIFIWEGK